MGQVMWQESMVPVVGIIVKSVFCRVQLLRCISPRWLKQMWVSSARLVLSSGMGTNRNAYWYSAHPLSLWSLRPTELTQPGVSVCIQVVSICARVRTRPRGAPRPAPLWDEGEAQAHVVAQVGKEGGGGTAAEYRCTCYSSCGTVPLAGRSTCGPQKCCHLSKGVQRESRSEKGRMNRIVLC
jgi:hypothetical protein